MTQPITIEDIYQLFRTSQQEADRRFAEFDKRVAEAKAEAERRAIESKTEADYRMAKLEQIVAQTSKEVSALSSRWGRFLENFIEPGVVSLFQERGIAVMQTFTRVKSRKQGVAMEIDILATDTDVAIVVEVKSRLKREDIGDFLAKIPKFKQSFPIYQNYRVYGAIAAIEFDEHTDMQAYQQGLFVIKQSGETIVLANDENFQPILW